MAAGGAAGEPNSYESGYKHVGRIAGRDMGAVLSQSVEVEPRG